MAHDINLLRYHRLRDEMDKLVAPLYLAALSANIEKGNLGWFQLIAPARRYYPEHKHVTAFWDEIKRNLHLSSDKEILYELMTLFQKCDEYWHDEQSSSSRNVYISQLKRLDAKIRERYPTLKNQIAQIEHELGVSFANLKEEIKQKEVILPKKVNI